MTKFETLYKVYEIRNRIKILEGHPPLDLELMKYKIEDEAFRRNKPDIEDSLTQVEKQYENLRKAKETEAKTNAFYATPQGMVKKAQLETAIESKIKQWDDFENKQAGTVEAAVRKELGEHWGVSRFNKGYVQLSVIDFESPDPETRKYYFGQNIELYYETRRWFSDKNSERFESSVGTTGSFSADGGKQVGERAMFYAGVGKLYGNPELIGFIKNTMKNTEIIINKFVEELENLRKTLKDPFSEELKKPAVQQPPPAKGRTVIKR